MDKIRQLFRIKGSIICSNPRAQMRGMKLQLASRNEANRQFGGLAQSPSKLNNKPPLLCHPREDFCSGERELEPRRYCKETRVDKVLGEDLQIIHKQFAALWLRLSEV